jgi:hypothetical protein
VPGVGSGGACAGALKEVAIGRPCSWQANPFGRWRLSKESPSSSQPWLSFQEPSWVITDRGESSIPASAVYAP